MVCVISICEEPLTTPLFAFIVPAKDVAVTEPVTDNPFVILGITT